MKIKSYALLLIAALTIIFSPGAANAQTATALSTGISQEIGFGSRGAQVSMLQQFLAQEPNIYPEGIISGYYGPLTRAAVLRFQRYFGISPVGRVGPITRSRINSIVLTGRALDIQASAIFTTTISTSSPSSARIVWNTNEMTRGKVFFSNTPLVQVETSETFKEPYISGQVVQTPGASNVQSVDLTGLNSSTVFYYVIQTIDASGNVSVTVPRVFTTRM